MFRSLTLFAFLALTTESLGAQTPDTARIDALFARWATDASPGCVLGIQRNDRPWFDRAWGMADLEHGIRNTPATILEAGSVSKQVTAAAVALLAARGTLSLDDDVRRWFPELPRYDAVITVRHLLQHTSGLRDWGAVAAIEGWPRGSRAVTHDDVLASIARQRGLNHPVGGAYSYTNSGYNLLVMLVERAAKEPFPAFTRREFFAPLGMRSTSWRDDFARVVPGRAQAYARSGGAWRLDMPFEQAYGNGGLLTTTGDLLRWTTALAAGRLGSPDVSRVLQTPGALRDGTPITYGLGLTIHEVRGVREISHSGATAGYRAFLARWPASGVAAALLCNAGDANATALIRDAVADLVAWTPAPPAAPAAATPTPPPTLTAAQRAGYLGRWRNDEVPGVLGVTLHGDTLVLTRRPGERAPLRHVGPHRFTALGLELRFEGAPGRRPTRLLVSIPRALNVVFTRLD